jgi:hypothetical protein
LIQHNKQVQRLKSMTRSNFLLTLSLIFITVLCKAQTNITVGTDSIKKTPATHFLYLFNHYPGFYTSRSPSFNYDFYKSDQDNFRRLFSGTTYPYQPLLRLDYAPFLTPANFSTLSRHDFYYQYDPSNPYGAMNPAEGIINGSLDYLIGKLFDEK